MSGTAHRADVDGLRGVAVTLVVVFHAWPALLPGGFVGVDAFFVVSGFVVSRMLARERAQGTFSLGRFFVRRVNRLAPALLVVLLATLAAAMAWLSPTLLGQTAGAAASALALCANFFFAAQAGYFDAAATMKPLLHLWSLSVEEQFYLSLSVALALGRRVMRGGRAVALSGAALSFVACVWLAGSPFTYFSPLTRAWELLLGVVVGLSADRGGSRHAGATAALGLAGLAVSAVVLDGAVPFPGVAALAPVLATATVLWHANGTVVARWLSARPLVWLGLVSYPLYLWHWPVLTLARLTTPRAQHAAVSGVAVALSVGLAWLTLRFVEAPIRARQRVATAVGAVVVSALLFVLGVAVLLSPTRWSARGPLVAQLSEFERTYDYRTDGRLGSCWLLDDAVGLFDDDCVEREPSGQPLVLVWGDSHAARLTAGLRAVQAERPVFRLAQRTRSSCAPVFEAGTRACRESFFVLLDEAKRLDPDVVVLAGRWRSLAEPSPIARAVERIAAALPRARIVVVGPLPEWVGTLPWVLGRAGGDTLPERLVPEGLDEQRAFDAAVRAALPSSVRSVSALESLCVPIDGCLAVLSRAPLVLSSWDYGHLTTPAAKIVARNVVVAWEPGRDAGP